ncbi:MAG: hypothetical protein DBY43_05675 [Clostridiaceae bacterium]|nr:MAG: hypothetical protein DBY43_05675 [Clostridiaceae bacterium]
MTNPNMPDKSGILDALLPLSALGSQNGLALQHVERAVLEFKNLFLESWIEASSHSDFYDVLRIASQRIARAKRHCGDLSDREKTLYFLGILSGLEYAFKELYTAEEREKMIATTCSGNERASQILQAIYFANGGQEVYHEKLAELVGLSYGNLTEEMKFLLNCRAVAATGRGKSTCYTLTPAGKRYCMKSQNEKE